MGVKHGPGIVGRGGGASAGGIKVVKDGTLETSGGPITWTLAANGTLNAEGGGQKLTITGTDESDGSWQRHSVFSRVGADPYLTIHAAIANAARSAGTTLEAGQSQLTLAITHIDAAVTSGTATVSGTLAGAAVNGTGPVDLTSNPLAGRAVPEWPQGAFKVELQETAFFAPLAKTLAPQTTAAPPPVKATTGTRGGLHIESAGGVIGRAGAWCLGGAIAGSGAGPETFGASILLGCTGGATASILNDFVSWLDEPVPDPEPLPIIDLPLDPPDSGPSTQTQPDDPPPPPLSDPPDSGPGGDPSGSGDIGGGGGGSKPPEDGGPVLKED